MAGIIGRAIDAIMIQDRIYGTAYSTDVVPDDPTPTPGKYTRSFAVEFAKNHVNNLNHKSRVYTAFTPCSYFGKEH